MHIKPIPSEEEIEGILQDPEGALEQLRKLGGGLFGTVDDGGQSGSPSDGSVENLLSDGVAKGLGKLLGASDGEAPATGSAGGTSAQDKNKMNTHHTTPCA